MERLLYGAAYYEEYLPVDRLEKDVEMMKAAGINVVRIAESTWSTCEPQDGVFDFSHVERVLDAMEQAGISVIIGTPTYAVPTWMVKGVSRGACQDETGTGHLWGAPDYGHYQSGLFVLRGTCNPEADGAHGAPQLCDRLSAGQ